ncbi:MAG: Tfp pilus assembly protein PilF [Colwellia sp.]|jgi:Tfp pilus assembly protein PilF
MNKNNNSNTPIISKTHIESLRLASTLHKNGKIQQAEKIYRSLVSAYIAQETIYSQLALICAQTNRMNEAKALSFKALDINSNLVDSLLLLGDIFRIERNFPLSVQNYKLALEQVPNHATAHYNLSISFASLGLINESLASCRLAISINPKLSHAKYHLGQTLLMQNNHKEAKLVFTEIISTTENNHDALYAMGNLYKSEGELAKAKHYYQQVLSADSSYTQAHFTLASIHKYQDCHDPHLTEMLKQFNKQHLLKEKKIHLSFAIAKAYEDIKKYKTSFDYLEIGNKLRFEYFNYNINTDKEFIESIINTFNKSAINEIRTNAFRASVSNSNKPIFIVGMPRSGTTLVEKIISSHSQVYGAGELENFFRLGTSSLINKSTNFLFSDLNKYLPTLFEDIGTQYLKQVENLSNVADRITDKLPFNMLMIGLIKIVFPQATIIHCVRNAEDNCLSIFKKNFTTDNYRFAYDLTALGKFHKLYQKTMKHWHATFPGEIHDIMYESLVNDPEQNIRELIKVCNLEWQDECLNFNSSKLIVKTASAFQVRQPIYTDSVALWKHYKPFLGPLLKELE